MFENQIIENLKEIEELSNNIIKVQEEKIKILENHIIELREIIEKYILKK